jgi:hypothetical protein
MPMSTSSSAGKAVGDEPKRFFQKRALEAVHDEAVEFALHHQRRLADGDHQRPRPLDDLRRRPWRRDDLRRGDQVGRVDRVDDEAAVPAGQRLGEGGGQDRRGRGGEHRIGWRERIEPGEDRPLHLDVLRRVLLDVAGAGERRVQVVLAADRGEHLVGRPAAEQVVSPRGRAARRG